MQHCRYPVKSLLCSVLFAASSQTWAGDESCLRWGEIRSDAASQMNTLGAGNQQNFHLKGELIYRFLKQEEEGSWVGMQLHHPQVKTNQDWQSNLAYSVPFAVLLQEQTGEILQYRFMADLKAEDKEKLTALFQSLHLKAKPMLLNAKEYQLQDHDSLGTYQVRYRELEDDRILRSRLRYLDNQQTRPALAMLNLDKIEIHQDQYEFKEEGCWHAKVSGQSDIQLVSKDGSMDIRVTQELLWQQSSEPLSEDVSLLHLPEDPDHWQPLSADLIYPPPPRHPLETEEAFLTQLRELDFSAKDRSALMQFIYDNDIYLYLLQDVIANQELADDQEKVLFLLLGKADTRNAHQLLADIYLQDSMTSNQRFRSLMALKYSHNPLDEALVIRLFDHATSTTLTGNDASLARSCMLVMGVIANNQLNSPFADSLTQRLANQLNQATSAHEAGLYLSAIGNSQDSDYEPMLADYLQHTNTQLRIKAADALGKMPGRNSLGYLNQRLAAESEFEVQSAILKAMGSNPLPMIQMNHVMSFTDSPSPEVRRSAYKAIGQQKNKSPETISALKARLKSEKGQQNLKALMDAIYSN